MLPRIDVVAPDPEEAASLFVSGWRPAIGWVGVLALGYQFLAYPLLLWAWVLLQGLGRVARDLAPPPVLNTDALLVLLTGVLGIAGARTYEKVKHVQRNALVRPARFRQRPAINQP